MAKYKVVTPVDHDGERFEPGKTIELDDAFAKPLLAVNAISAGKGKAGAASNAQDDEKSDEVAGD